MESTLSDILLGNGSPLGHNILGDNRITAIFDYFLKLLPGAIYYKDKDGKYLGCSDYLVVASGFKGRGDVLGKTDYDLFPREQAELLREHDKRVMHEGKTLVLEEKITTPTNKTQYFEVVKTPLHNISGEVVGIIGNSIEITDRVRTEQKLVTAKKKAEQANELKNQFISNMEHDLRTPCSGIAEMTKMLEKTATEKESKKMLGHVSKAADRLLEILNGILEFDHVESGRLPILFKKFNLEKLLGDILALEIPHATTKKLKLILKHDETIPKVLIGDEFRVSRILLNLISNAIKFTEKGSITITSEFIKKIGRKNILLKFGIKDTGIGIPEDKQRIIYERFTRIQPANKGSQSGSGLGLCIVRTFIDELGGEIEVRSKHGNGSTFECLLPFELSLLDDAPVNKNQKKNNNTISDRKKSGAPQKSFNILLVEDDILAQKVTSIMLKQEFNFNVDIASTGAEALEKCYSKTYDLIFMDIGLPDISGHETTQAVRKSKKSLNKKTIIVALTAHNSELSRNDCKNSGMDDFIVKPINAEKTETIISNWLDEEGNIKKPKKIHSRKISKILKKEDIKLAIDLELAKELSGGNEKLAWELIEILVNDIPKAKIDLEHAYKENLLEELIARAHKLQGSSCYCGTESLRKHVKKLEIAAREKDHKKTKNQLKKVYEEMDAILEAYDQLTRA